MTASIAISGLGVICALAGMAVLIFKRISPIIIGPLAALLVCITSQLPILEGIKTTYLEGVAGFFMSYFLIFLLGNIFGNIYQNSGAAASIGAVISRTFGPKR